MTPPPRLPPEQLPPARRTLKSADVVDNDLKEVLLRIETLEKEAAKSQHVHDLSERFGEFQRQAEKRDYTILSDLSDMRQAQRATSRSTTTWLRFGLPLLATLGAIAPFLSDTIRSNPEALGPYGVVIVAVLAAIGHAAKHTGDVKPNASADNTDVSPPTPPAHS